MKKRILAWLLSAVIVLNTGIAAFAADENTFVALGADLTQEQRATVLELLELTEEELAECKVDYITNEEEHQYLDEYVDPSVIGTRSLSSVKVIKQKKAAELMSLLITLIIVHLICTATRLSLQGWRMQRSLSQDRPIFPAPQH